MGIWDSLRLFSRRGGSHSRRGSKGKRGRGAKVSKPRDLRLEQFEDRVLLSITPYEGDDTYFVDDLGKAHRPIQERMVGNLSKADPEFGKRVSEGLALN